MIKQPSASHCLHAAQWRSYRFCRRVGSRNCRRQMSNNFLRIYQLQMRSTILHDKICVNEKGADLQTTAMIWILEYINRLSKLVCFISVPSTQEKYAKIICSISGAFKIWQSGSITGGLGVRPPDARRRRPRECGGVAPAANKFLVFKKKNTHFSTLFYRKRACSDAVTIIIKGRWCRRRLTRFNPHWHIV